MKSSQATSGNTQSAQVQPLPNPADTQYTHLPLGVPQLGIPQAWETILQNQTVAAAYAHPSRPQLLTIYMLDYRVADPTNPDHLMAELNMALYKDANEQLWVNADEMVRNLQGTPGRIDGMAKLSIKRGMYRQLFCRLSTTSIEKCHPDSLRVTPERSIEIVIEPTTNPPPSQPPITTVPAAATSKRQHSMEDRTPSPASEIRPKRRRPDELHMEPNALPTIASGSSNVFVSAVDNASSPPDVGTSTSAVDVKLDGRRNRKHQLAKAAITPWLRSRMEIEEGYEAFTKSKGKLLSLEEALKGFRFARAMLQKYGNTLTPEDLEGAPSRKITKVNVWQALDRQSSWGSDSEATLTLMERYGPEGPDEHPKVVEMLSGQWDPEEREGCVLFLQHLKRIDAEYKTGLGVTGSPHNGEDI